MLPRGTTVPMEAVWKQQVPGQSSPRLVVFLPGRHDEPEDFERNGFLKAMWDSGISADAVLPDAHLGYYYERNFSERFNEDIINEARSRGYKSIWAVGVSLGGFGAVMFERDHPGTWDGIVLVAPFTGDQRSVLKKIRSAPSLKAVEFAPHRTNDEYTANFWERFQTYLQDPEFPIILGYGAEDRMAIDQSMLARELNQQHVVLVPGGHNWHAWKQLWSRLLPILREHSTN